MTGVRDLIYHQRALRTVLVDFWPERPLFAKSNDVPLQFLTDRKLRLVRTSDGPVTAEFWAINRKVDLQSSKPQRLRAAVFHGSSLLCVADGIGVVRHCLHVSSKNGVHCYVAKWKVDGLDLSISFWRKP